VASFVLIYPYTYLLITDIVLAAKNGNKRNKGAILTDYYLQITLKKTNGERRSFSVNLISYIHTMHVPDHSEDIVLSLNLAIAQDNIASKAINSQEPYYDYVEVALEHNITSTNKPVELKIYYQDCEGLELNKV
jgi:DNA polymerase II large subunit